MKVLTCCFSDLGLVALGSLVAPTPEVYHINAHPHLVLATLQLGTPKLNLKLKLIRFSFPNSRNYSMHHHAQPINF